MDKATKDVLKEYEKACRTLALFFVRQYYKGSFDNGYWIGDEVGGVFGVGDAFWSVEDMATALRINAPVKKLHAWYWSFEEDGARNFNLKSFCKLKTLPKKK